MDIEVLGALAVRENGVSIVPTAPKPRHVLALLALHADQVVPVGALVEELWGAKVPRSARTTLQTYILQLRELIEQALAAGGAAGCGSRAPGGGGAKEVLATVPGGYRLNTTGGTVDYRRFEVLAAAGYRAMDGEDFSEAAGALAQALALWSGPALTDIQVGLRIGMEARRLEEARLCALDQRIEADLRLGRHRELLPELTVLVNQHRMHESLHGQFMLALHRSGRRGEALDVYQRLRSTLVAELGLEPSPALARLQRSILMARPEPPLGGSAARRLVARTG
ncbi:AfsR/SARP family transcriptional regulator [Actinacidiphila rubida]|uniref:DNA-binding transcriptional activator of the SARP family n=1 Tax=Actinacidiphila rubida TaxID=310780 RepID=A0A1H8R5M2_9ACTN|nr:AfsR/SARP family transcriptional regulator [Actinacidiphila rubida]SEO61636.1 DNA-binding transcriptional activator of the SARP family [Actinacidiphila rubida]